jgi:hypothetical protein
VQGVALLASDHDGEQVGDLVAGQGICLSGSGLRLGSVAAAMVTMAAASMARVIRQCQESSGGLGAQAVTVAATA